MSIDFILTYFFAKELETLFWSEEAQVEVLMLAQKLKAGAAGGDEDGRTSAGEEAGGGFVFDVIEDEQRALVGAVGVQLGDDGVEIAFEFEAELPGEIAGDLCEVALLAGEPVDGVEVALMAMGVFEGEGCLAQAGDAGDVGQRAFFLQLLVEGLDLFVARDEQGFPLGVNEPWAGSPVGLSGCGSRQILPSRRRMKRTGIQ